MNDGLRPVAQMGWRLHTDVTWIDGEAATHLRRQIAAVMQEFLRGQQRERAALAAERERRAA